MGNKNTNLQMAKNAKDDEFYTTYETVEKEMAHYVQHFERKTVLCNCDDPFESNFCKFFLKNFNVLNLKRLICTSFSSSKVMGTQVALMDDDSEVLTKGNGYVLDITGICEGQGELSDEYVTQFLLQSKVIKKLKGNGDFRSDECLQYLAECDIVVTNPPFSLFKEIVAEIVKYKKNFLIIGNQNALTYKEIFPLIQNNEVWTGYQFGEMKFRVPDSSEPRSTRYWVDETGQKWRSLGNAMWLTNLDNDRTIIKINGKLHMLYIHNKGNQFQVERDFFEYIDGNSIPYVILCEDDNTHVLYYLKLNKKANWVKSCFDTCDKDVIYLGKQVLNSKVTEIDLIKELKKY